MTRLCCIFMCVGALFLPVAAQDAIAPYAQWRAPLEPVLVGQPFDLEVVIVLPAGSELIDPALPVVWGEFWLKPMAPLENTVQADGSRLYRQRFSATLWTTGQLATPDLTLQYQVAGQGSLQTLPLPAIAMQVNSILDPNDLNLRPMRPPLAMPYVSPLMVAGGFVMMVGGAYLLWQQVIKRHMNAAGRVPATPARLALDDLNRAARIEDPVRLHIRVAEVLRRFAGAHAGIPVIDLTTQELLDRLPPASVPEPRRAELQQLLDYADLVKFAQVTPSSNQRMIGAARRWVSEVARIDHA
jgi:hypothetical protein